MHVFMSVCVVAIFKSFLRSSTINANRQLSNQSVAVTVAAVALKYFIKVRTCFVNASNFSVFLSNIWWNECIMMLFFYQWITTCNFDQSSSHIHPLSRNISSLSSTHHHHHLHLSGVYACGFCEICSAPSSQETIET